jgi:hypothetical protein
MSQMVLLITLAYYQETVSYYPTKWQHSLNEILIEIAVDYFIDSTGMIVKLMLLLLFIFESKKC